MSVTKMTHNNFVRFFYDYVICDHCGEETRGRCYAETQRVVCSKCKSVLLEVDDEIEDPTEGMVIVTFIPEFDDGESD